MLMPSGGVFALVALGLAALAETTPPKKTVEPFASFDKGMGVTSADGNFSVGVHFLFQTRYEHSAVDGVPQDGFRLFMARPALRGAAFRPWLKYFFQWELAGASSSLLDAELSAQPIPEIGIKVGQFVTPFSREFLVPPWGLLFPDFAPSNILFRNNRDTGAMVSGELFGRLEYALALVNGNGINKSGNDNAQLEWMGRAAVDVFGKNPYTEIPQLVAEAPGLSLGVNTSYADIEQTTTSLDPATNKTSTRKLGSSPTRKLGVDLSFHAGPLSLQSEAYSRITEAVGGGPRSVARGGFLQLGVFVIPRTLELAARGDLIDADATRSTTLDKRVDGGLAYYVRDNHLKLQLRYAWADSPNAMTPSPRGTSNAVTLQAQLWF